MDRSAVLYSELWDLNSSQNQSRRLLTVSLVALASDAGALEGLVVVEAREDAEDDGRAAVELDAHERLRHGVADVLEVHRRALDEHADGDDGVERLLALVLLVAGGRRAPRAVALDEREQVRRRDERVGARRLRLAALDQPGVSSLITGSAAVAALHLGAVRIGKAQAGGKTRRESAQWAPASDTGESIAEARCTHFWQAKGSS